MHWSSKIIVSSKTEKKNSNEEIIVLFDYNDTNLRAVTCSSTTFGFSMNNKKRDTGLLQLVFIFKVRFRYGYICIYHKTKLKIKLVTAYSLRHNLKNKITCYVCHIGLMKASDVSKRQYGNAMFDNQPEKLYSGRSFWK